MAEIIIIAELNLRIITSSAESLTTVVVQNKNPSSFRKNLENIITATYFHIRRGGCSTIGYEVLIKNIIEKKKLFQFPEKVW